MTSLEDLINSGQRYDVASGEGFIFLKPIQDDVFDHTMYKCSTNNPNEVENYDYIQFIVDGYASKESIQPIDWDEFLEKYSQK